MRSTRVVVVGGGVAGLSCAWFLLRTAPPDLNLDVRVLEVASIPGGKVRSEREDGMLFEWGPHGILDDAEDTRTLIEEIGLADRVVRARESMKRRWVLWNGRLHDVPTSPPALLKTSLLSFGAKLRVFKEPFVKPIDAYDESIADFAARRFGVGVVEPLVEPGVAGIFAGDVKQLSLRSAFPKLHALEQEHGSILKGFKALSAKRRERGQGAPTLLSFRDGMGELPTALARALRDRVFTDARITSIARDGSGYAIDVDGASVPTMRADSLVLACSSQAAKRLVASFDPDLASNLGLIPTAPIAVVCLVYEREQVGHPLDGFGFLCARRENRAILGAIFASSVFDGHATEGRVQLRALLGGALGRKNADLDDDALATVVTRELGEILSIRGEPKRVRIFRHPQAIPQYVVGHHARLAAIDSQLNRHPQLYVVGASYRGVSVNDCIQSGRVVAGNLLRHRLNA